MYITEKLGGEIPIITNAAGGIIGVDAKTNVLREVCVCNFFSLICLKYIKYYYWYLGLAQWYKPLKRPPKVPSEKNAPKF